MVKSWQLQSVRCPQKWTRNMGEKSKERGLDACGIILQLTRFPEIYWELKYLRKTFPPLPAVSTSQYYALKEIFKLREVQSYVGKIDPGKGKARGWISRWFRVQPGKQQPGDVQSHPTVLGGSWTQQVSPAIAFPSVPSTLALYRENP